jgi:hypothetical protein
VEPQEPIEGTPDNGQPDEGRKAAVADIMRWLDTIPPESIDWAEALLHAALDESNGDLSAALAMAQKGLAENPTPPPPEESNPDAPPPASLQATP